MEALSTLAKSLASDQLKVRRRAQIEAADVLSMPFKDDGKSSVEVWFFPQVYILRPLFTVVYVVSRVPLIICASCKG